VYHIQDFKKWWLEVELRTTATHFIIHAGNNRKVNAEFIAEVGAVYVRISVNITATLS